MAKTKRKDTVEDIMDRIQEEIDTLRDKVYELENNQCECDSSEDEPEDWSDDEDEDEDSDKE